MAFKEHKINLTENILSTHISMKLKTKDASTKYGRITSAICRDFKRLEEETDENFQNRLVYEGYRALKHYVEDYKRKAIEMGYEIKD